MTGSQPSEPPDRVRRVAELMATFDRDWCLCGGWAVDAWLGRQTREHVDVDLVAFADDQRAIFEHLHGWRLVAHERVEDEHEDAWDGRPVAVGTHVHARKDGEPEVELFLDRRDRDAWVLRDDPRIEVPVERAVAVPRWRLPTASSEILCFYKATAYDQTRDHDRADLAALEPTLTIGQRAWLDRATATVRAAASARPTGSTDR